MNKLLLLFCIGLVAIQAMAQPAAKPRILISSDIGGTDQDDNQSMLHFLMYSNKFNAEGLVSSPSFGHGSKQEILNMIALYEKDLPKLSLHAKDFPAPDSLRNISKQGRLGAAALAGYSTATEGSNWIIHCAHKKSDQPLWVLVWGGLDDLAQALYDAPDIQQNIKVYWIGGPNKKFSTNCYTYIATQFPNLWFIENNASYRGFFAGKALTDSVSNNTFYDQYIQAAGAMGKPLKTIMVAE